MKGFKVGQLVLADQLILDGEKVGLGVVVEGGIHNALVRFPLHPTAQWISAEYLEVVS